MPDFPSKGAINSIICIALIIFVVLLRIIQMSHQSETLFRSVVEGNLLTEFSNLEAQLNQFEERVKQSAEVDFQRFSHQSEYPYFLFKNRRLVFWSQYHHTPKYVEIASDFQFKYVEGTKGKYILRKSLIDHGQGPLEVVFLLPLSWDPKIVNQYIKPDFNEKIFSHKDFEIAEVPLQDVFGEIRLNNETIFSIRFGATYEYVSRWMKFVMYFLLLAFFIFLFRSLIDIADYFASRHQYVKGFFCLFSLIIGIRSLMLMTRFPFSILPLDLFDVQNYASSIINPSLGDLLLNLLAIGALAWYIFNTYYKSDLFKKLIGSKSSVRRIVSVLLSMLTYFWLLIHYYIVESMSFHSQWSMDVTENLEFSYLKIISYLIFLISGVNFFLLTHISYKLFFKINHLRSKEILWLFISGTLLFIAFSLVFGWDYKVIVIVNVLFYFVLVWFQLPRYIGKIQYLTFVYFFICGIPGALTGAYANYQYYLSNANYVKEKLASQLLVENDLFAEYIISEAAEKIREDSWIQGQILNPYTSKRIINQYIRSKYISNYLDQYDIQIFVFNSRGNSFESSASRANYFELKDQVKGFEIADNENLYFIDAVDQTAAKRYRCFIEIKRRSLTAGYIMLNLKLKRFVPKTVYPLLLRDSRISYQPDHDFELSYGIFNRSRVIYNYGEFNYRKDLSTDLFENPKIYTEGVNENQYYHFGFRMDDGRTLIISSREYPLKNILANFSFLFLIYVFSILLILMFLAIYASFKGLKQNYATRIQLYLNFAFFMPLLILSLTTLSLIIRAYKINLESEYLEKAESLSGNIAPSVFDYQEQKINKVALLNRIYEIAQYAGLDINLFNSSGWLIASSQPLIYDNELLSNYINPQGYIDIVESMADHTVLNEQVGLLKYQNTYKAIKSFESGDLIGILSLPFYASKKDLDRQIINVLINIINIFTFIFIGFLFISFFASHGLTFPLKLITKKIQKTTLSGYNEPLSWNSEDEIGLMVKEYNRMLVNLEESKKALAKSEKESAWREMAKQVAHEIKNPLTPMKLTLQHMRRKIDMGAEEQNKEKEGQIDALLEQIDTLSDIATSFSAFAKMPIPQREEFDMRKLLLETIALYDKEEMGEIRFDIGEEPLLVKGDRQWIGRAISNIIINGFQASREGKDPVIEIRQYLKDQDIVRTEISDNGGGIPLEIQDKVFLPNFSTKFTGSGLGLAIAKKGIEHADGKIWFESVEGTGTVFYIELLRVNVV